MTEANDIAKKLNSHPRPVGNACRNNPLQLLIPCHRVIKSNGELGGYGGGIQLKKDLLKFERTNLNLRAH